MYHPKHLSPSAYCQQGGYSRYPYHSTELTEPTRHLRSTATAARAVTSLTQTVPGNALTSQSGLRRTQYPARRPRSPVTRPVPYPDSTTAETPATDHPAHTITQSTTVSKNKRKTTLLWRFLIAYAAERPLTGARYRYGR